MSRKKNQEDYDAVDEYSEDEDMEELDEEYASGEEEDEHKKLEKITDWGKKKGTYYEEEEGKDSDEDKEEAEEEEAKLIEKLNNERLKTQDFFDVFGDQSLNKSKVTQEDDEDTELQTQKMIKSKLREMEGFAESDKIAYLQRESPETVNIINEFKASIKELNLRLTPVLNHVKTNKTISKETINYLELRFNLLSSYAMNLCFYILLKLKEKNTQDHPVIQRIVHLKTQLNELKPIHKMLEPQFNKILRKIESAVEVKIAAQNILKPDSKKNKPSAPVYTKTQVTQLKVPSKSANGTAKRTQTFEEYSSGDDSEIDDHVGEVEEDEESDDEDYYRQIKKIKEDKREKINTQKKAKIEEQFEENPSYHVGEDDVREISRKILKNRGLTRKRKKIDRNSRVKLRKKFEKAEYKLKTKGIHYRKDKGTYDGEFTGVKAGLIKARKLKEL